MFVKKKKKQFTLQYTRVRGKASGTLPHASQGFVVTLTKPESQILKIKAVQKRV
jgi:hypothetical protein